MNNDDLTHHLKKFKRGNKDSFRWIFDRFHPVIYQYCTKLLLQKTLAQEATTDVFVKLWQKSEIIDSDHTILPLLYKIAKDTAYNYLKKIARDNRLKQRFVENYVLIDIKDSEMLLIEKEEWNVLSRIIETMPDRQQQIFEMRFWDGKSNSIIAEELDISLNTVKAHLAAGRKFLKQKINK